MQQGGEDYGIEVEVEANSHGPALENLRNTKVMGWKQVGEDSLRSGVEFISKEPVGREKKDKHVDLLYHALGKLDIAWTSQRTSIHVHINMSHCDMLQTYNFLTAYFLLENLLLSYCKPGRLGNLFCLSLADCDYIVEEIRKDLSNYNFMSFVMLKDRIRYGAINIGALGKFQSLEFRSLQGSATADEVKEWSTMYAYLRDASMKYRSPEHIVDDYFTSTPEDFVRRLLPYSFRRKVCPIGKSAVWGELLDLNLAPVSLFAYEVDWRVWAKRVEGAWKKKELALKRAKKKYNPGGMTLDLAEVAEPRTVVDAYAEMEARVMRAEVQARTQAPPRRRRRPRATIDGPAPIGPVRWRGQ